MEERQSVPVPLTRNLRRVRRVVAVIALHGEQEVEITKLILATLHGNPGRVP